MVAPSQLVAIAAVDSVVAMDLIPVDLVAVDLVHFWQREEQDKCELLKYFWRQFGSGMLEMQMELLKYEMESWKLIARNDVLSM